MKLRVCMRKIHLVAGLLYGLIFCILCLTGAMYLFRDEIERFADRDRYYIDTHNTEKRYNLDELLKQIEEEKNAKVESVFIPADPRRTCRIIMNNGAKGNSRLLYDIDPFTAKIKGQGAEKTASFFRFVKKVHTRLGLPELIGKPIIFTATVLFLPILITGFYLWRPSGGSFLFFLKNRLTIRLFSGKKRLLFDTHNVLGIYVLLPALLMVVSGIFLFFDHHGKTVASYCKAEDVFKNNTDFKDISNEISLERIFNNVKTNEHHSDITMRICSAKNGKYIMVNTKKSSFCGTSLMKVSYWDTTNGSLIERKQFSDLLWNQKLSVLIKPLHCGDFWGTSSKVFYLLICLAAAALPLSGFVIFLQKRRKECI